MNLFKKQTTQFPVSYSEIMQRIRNIDPVNYRASRNYINGAVSYLSPYISRGVISTKFVFNELLKKGYKPVQIEKFIQELAWRDYWQQVWIAKGTAINEDLKHTQVPVSNSGISKAINQAETGIEALDKSIEELYQTGYMHNHLRMYTAAVACNMGQSHWKAPAKWMYYHLLDADWASNALSWQWVAGANANKKYVANQENINKYCFTKQKDTFLDVPYEAFATMEIPEVLLETETLNLKTPLPNNITLSIDKERPTLLYNFYNLDPKWKNELLANKILILEPTHFEEYPISQNSLNFMLELAQENIPNIQVYVGEFDHLKKTHNLKEIYYKEHPLNNHYTGIEEPRDWMFEVQGYYPSFFAFWKKCKKQLNY